MKNKFEVVIYTTSLLMLVAIICLIVALNIGMKSNHYAYCMGYADAIGSPVFAVYEDSNECHILDIRTDIMLIVPWEEGE